jgi:uncharacterized protein YdiU (UPF0061 family)
MFAESNPAPSTSPSLVELNTVLLNQYGIDESWFMSEQGLLNLAGNEINPENPPIAMAYSGHQFAHWVPVLGDGRAHMLGQMQITNGTLVDVQLKGSGRTHYSRGGDGRATLGSVLREYLISEAMAGFGIPTTRSLAVIMTGEKVQREKSGPGAILVRSAASHIRVGTFQYASATQDINVIKALADYVIKRHFPELDQDDAKYLTLLSEVVKQQAELIAQWMLVGFIHGVMNTDNMSIVSETIDYGPCAFMDTFKPNKVFSSIDRHGRYAWDQQSNIAVWNLARFAETLLPLLDLETDAAVEALEALLAKFIPKFNYALQQGMFKKFAFEQADDRHSAFIGESLATLSDQEIDFTLFFNYLTNVHQGNDDAPLLTLFSDREKGIEWLNKWRLLKSDKPESWLTMRQANPVFIARNHQVEKAIRAAEDNGDFTLFRHFAKALANPFEHSPDNAEFEAPPLADEIVTQTFCGT